MSKKSAQPSGLCDEQQFWKLLKGGIAQDIEKVLFVNSTDDSGEVRRASNAVALANSKNSKHLTPLCFVVDSGYDDLVEILVRAGAKVNDVDGTKQKRTALHAAVAGEEDVIMQKLLQCGADLAAVDAEGHTVFHLAARMSARNILRYLVEVCGTLGSLEPLVVGVKVQSVNLVKLLAARDHSGATALHYALGEVGGGDAALDLATILLSELHTSLASNAEFVKDVACAVTSSGCTALHLLAASGASSLRIADLVKRAIAIGCDVSVTDADGQTALHYAALSSSGNAAVFAAIAAVMSPEQRNALKHAQEDGDMTRSPFEIAIAARNKAVIEWIVADKERLAGFLVSDRSMNLAPLVAQAGEAIQKLMCPAVVSAEDVAAAAEEAADEDTEEEPDDSSAQGDYSGHGSTAFAGSRVQAARKAASSRRKEAASTSNADDRAAMRKVKQSIAAAVEKKEDAAAQHRSQMGLGAKLLIGFMLMSFILPVIDYLLGPSKTR